MKVGCVGYAHSRGLGHLARDFYKHGVITHMCVVKHPSIPVNEDWYPGAPVVDARAINESVIKAFCREMDALLFFETPFLWQLLPWARQHTIRTYLVPMYECTPQNHSPPHKYLCPSLLDLQYFQGALGQNRPTQFLPLPVEYEWRQRAYARHFIHNGGYLGLKGSDGVQREGTTTLIEAMRWVQSPINLTIRVQENVSREHQLICAKDSRIDYLPQSIAYEELYATGDAVVGAQKWNGCSLPLQEAFAAGMLVINTDRFPMNTWLPSEPLVKPCELRTHKIGGPYLQFTESIIDPRDLATKIDAFYGTDISEYSLKGKKWAEENSWQVLGPKWKQALEE